MVKLYKTKSDRDIMSQPPVLVGYLLSVTAAVLCVCVCVCGGA